MVSPVNLEVSIGTGMGADGIVEILSNKLERKWLHPITFTIQHGLQQCYEVYLTAILG